MLWTVFLLTTVLQIALPVALISILWYKFSNDTNKRIATLSAKNNTVIFWFIVSSMGMCSICLSVYGSLLVESDILSGFAFFGLSALIFLAYTAVLLLTAVRMSGPRVLAHFYTFQGAVVLLFVQGALLMYGFVVAKW